MSPSCGEINSKLIRGKRIIMNWVRFCNGQSSLLAMVSFSSMVKPIKATLIIINNNIIIITTKSSGQSLL